MNTSDISPPQLDLYQQLLDILLAEHGQNWAPPIREIVQALTPPFASGEEQRDTIAEARRRFDAMLGGKGGLSEFYIARPNFGDQVAANKIFDALKEKILTN